MSIEMVHKLHKIIAVEEHVAFPHLMARIPESKAFERGYLTRDLPFGTSTFLDKLTDTEHRIELLNDVGISRQVLSYPFCGADLLPPAAALSWAKEMNDCISAQVFANRDRYVGLAHLPLTDPEASADELERAVRQLGLRGVLINGSTNGLYLDDPKFEPILARAEELDVPIYLHPAPSPKPARDALYAGLPDNLSFWLSVSGWGWHMDTAVHVLRLMLNNCFEKHPGLKIVIGHLGEGLQIMMARLDQQFHSFAGLSDRPSKILRRHVWVSTGGFFMNHSFSAALDAFGPDRLLFSVDYPWGSLEKGIDFLERLPVDKDTLDKIAYGNAEKIFKICTV